MVSCAETMRFSMDRSSTLSRLVTILVEHKGCVDLVVEVLFTLNNVAKTGASYLAEVVQG